MLDMRTQNETSCLFISSPNLLELNSPQASVLARAGKNGFTFRPELMYS